MLNYISCSVGHLGFLISMQKCNALVFFIILWSINNNVSDFFFLMRVNSIDQLKHHITNVHSCLLYG